MAPDKKPTVLFVAMLGEPGRYDPSLYAHLDGGDDEVYWFREMLAEADLLHQIDFKAVRLAHGELLPEPNAFDAIIVGGSYHSVHDDLSWQHDLVAWLRSVRTEAKPVFGICGGHQIMGQMDGVAVDSVPSGPMAATIEIDLTDDGRTHFLFDGLHQSLRFHFGNYERLASPPTGAKVLAASEQMPAMALDHGGNWFSVQFHPEAKAAVLSDSWTGENERYRENYEETPEAPVIFRNFLHGTGVLK